MNNFNKWLNSPITWKAYFKAGLYSTGIGMVLLTSLITYTAIRCQKNKKTDVKNEEGNGLENLESTKEDEV